MLTQLRARPAAALHFLVVSPAAVSLLPERRVTIYLVEEGAKIGSTATTPPRWPDLGPLLASAAVAQYDLMWTQTVCRAEHNDLDLSP